jgi:hypothetical protein
MRSLRLLQKPPKCVAQLSRAVCIVPRAVREDDALGLPGQHRLVQGQHGTEQIIEALRLRWGPGRERRSR